MSNCEDPELINEYMADKIFRFPMVRNIFNPDSKSQSSIMAEIKQGLIFPYLAELRLHVEIEVEMGIAEKDLDRIGL